MKEDIYYIVCPCQTIINKQANVSHNKIRDKS
mgnify:CR=1 FL=1